MERLFELVAHPAKQGEKQKEIFLGVRVKLSSFEAVCPLTASCKSYSALEAEVQGIRQNLEDTLEEARRHFEGSSQAERLGLRPDMKPQEIWRILSAVSEEKEFIQAFNALEEGKRKEVAEHVLTHCNVFSGKAAVFSSRYDEQSALME